MVSLFFTKPNTSNDSSYILKQVGWGTDGIGSCNHLNETHNRYKFLFKIFTYKEGPNPQSTPKILVSKYPSYIMFYAKQNYSVRT